MDHHPGDPGRHRRGDLRGRDLVCAQHAQVKDFLDEMLAYFCWLLVIALLFVVMGIFALLAFSFGGWRPGK
jgi:hypothetical protein